MSAALGIWFATEGMDSAGAVRFARRVEDLGYASLWLGETFGRDPFVHMAHLGHEARRLGFATGIANVYLRHPGAMKQAASTLAEQLAGRFTLGLGVSSPLIVSGMRGLDASRPLSFMREYLDALDSAPYVATAPSEPVRTVLAALGPRMLELAAERTAGAHTYNMTPGHTRVARGILGPSKRLVVEQKVLLAAGQDEARETIRGALRFYRKAPGYRNAWKRLGFEETEIDAGAPRFVDSIVVWGGVDAIRGRLDEHFEAGASEVLVHPLHPESGLGVPDWEILEALAPAASARRPHGSAA